MKRRIFTITDAAAWWIAPTVAWAAEEVVGRFDPTTVTTIQWAWAVFFAVSGWGTSRLRTLMGFFSDSWADRLEHIQRIWFSIVFGLFAYMFVRDLGYPVFYAWAASTAVGYFGERSIGIAMRYWLRLKGEPPPRGPC